MEIDRGQRDILIRSGLGPWEQGGECAAGQPSRSRAPANTEEASSSTCEAGIPPYLGLLVLSS